MSDAPRKPNGTFQKGASGNPGGFWRDGKLRKLRRALEALDPRMMEVLEEMTADSDPKIRAKAVEIWGKYRIPVPREGKGDNATTSAPTLSAELAARLASLQ
jgi:hypothetical protein